MRKSLSLIGILLFYFVLAGSAFAQAANPTIPLNAPSGMIPSDTPATNIGQFIINLIFIVGLIIAVIFLIYGGIKWILSGGDKTAVENARNHIIAAIIGLVIIAAAFFIISFVFQLLGVDNPLTQNFRLPSLNNPNP